MTNILHNFARRNVKILLILLCVFVLILVSNISNNSYWIYSPWSNKNTYTRTLAYSNRSYDSICVPRRSLLNMDLNKLTKNLTKKEDLEYDFNTTKLILDWTAFFDYGLEEKCYLEECPHYNCRITKDRSKLSEADAIAFHPLKIDLDDLPQKRKPEQYFLYHSVESPSYTRVDLSTLESNFNATLTYRQGSDIHFSFGNVHRRTSPINRTRWRSEITEIASKKTKLVSWFVSNCYTPSKRELYAQVLGAYIQVDIYGQCSRLKCPRSLSVCDSMIEKDYKFYLSFENSLCMEYATEKLFKRLKQAIVPIVLTRRFYRNIYLPPKSIIAADEFCTIEDLANYLMYLDKNLTAYLEYFDWKYEYEVTDDSMCPSTDDCGFCRFCRLLHKQERPRKIFRNIQKWWFKDAPCDNNIVFQLLAGSTRKADASIDDKDGRPTCYSSSNWP